MKPRSFSLFVLSFALCCCGAYSKNAVTVGAPGTIVSPRPQEYRLAVGDKINIKLFYNPDLNQEVTVRPDGKISLLLVHEVDAVGLTPSELTKQLIENYGKYLQQPEVAVVVNSFAGQKVFVGGEVGAAGVKELVGPTTVLQVIAMSGGFRDTARLDEVIIIRRDENNKPFTIALDAKKAMKGIDLTQDIYVQPFDLVLVPKSNIADVDVWVQQYIGTLTSIGSPFTSYYFFTK
ncbi:MAG TPA: polysaccharide biosynthesis/export family protein [Syntrophobacteraceae bacterium]|nr:polysaccharide biosynthesis/export family protein [Syntrophobacteraceae bacterium]